MVLDELSLLEADSIDSEILASESALKPVQRPDFTGSLDYIDSLASRSALAISQRDAAGIATTLYSLSQDDVKPVSRGAVSDLDQFQSLDFHSIASRDGRMFDPSRSTRLPAASVRSSSRVVSPSLSSPYRVPPGWRNPLDPDRDPVDIERAQRESERRISRKPFAFHKPSQVDICVKRKLRRMAMHAFGFSGVPRFPFRRPHRNYWSRVIC